MPWVVGSSARCSIPCVEARVLEVVQGSNVVEAVDLDRVPSNRGEWSERDERRCAVRQVDKQGAAGTGVGVALPLEAAGVPDGWIRRELLADVHVSERPVVVAGVAEPGQFRGRIRMVITSAERRVHLRVQQRDLGKLTGRHRKAAGQVVRHTVGVMPDRSDVPDRYASVIVDREASGSPVRRNLEPRRTRQASVGR